MREDLNLALGKILNLMEINGLGKKRILSAGMSAGATLAALEDLMKVILQRRADGDGARVRLDVGGYQERRREALAEFARGIAAKVVESGNPAALAPMHPADRKLVHDTIAEIEGVQTESQGMDPDRRIIVRVSE